MYCEGLEPLTNLKLELLIGGNWPYVIKTQILVLKNWYNEFFFCLNKFSLFDQVASFDLHFLASPEGHKKFFFARWFCFSHRYWKQHRFNCAIFLRDRRMSQVGVKKFCAVVDCKLQGPSKIKSCFDKNLPLLVWLWHFSWLKSNHILGTFDHKMFPAIEILWFFIHRAKVECIRR